MKMSPLTAVLKCPHYEKGIIAMSQKERQRYHLLKMVIGGKIALKETDNLMGVSYRQAKRLKKKLISEGAKGLIHGNRGRPSPKALSRGLLRGYSISPSASIPPSIIWHTRAEHA